MKLVLNKQKKTSRLIACRAAVEALETRRMLDGEGLSTIYFNGTSFTGNNLTRVETQVNGSWNGTTPGAGIGANFTARYAGRVAPVESGAYTFSVPVRGSVRMWVDDVLQISQFTDQTATHTTVPISLVAGKSYHIVLEYRASGTPNTSQVSLRWTRPGQPTSELVPQSQLSADNRTLPTGAFSNGAVGFFNVKTAFGAVGDGVTDDTDAIQLAIDFAKGSSWGGSVYFPAGTYRVTNSLDYVSAANLALRGQNRDNVIIRLDDAAFGFSNVSSPKSLLTMFNIPGGNTGNQFGNSIFDMTFDTGANNPGAIGVNWLNNNQGSMRDVTVRSSDATRRGITGVDLSSPWPGPALFTNVLVEGFNYAFRNTGQFNYSQTFDKVNIQNQLVNGVYNDNGSMFFRNLRSINSVPAIRNVFDSSNFVLIDSVLMGGSASEPAIINYGSATLRNVSTSGYSTPIGYFWNLPGNYVSEFVTGAEFVGNGPFGGFNVRNGAVGFAPSSLVSLDLPVEEAPTPPTEDPTLWVRVNPAAADDTANIQAAFNTAASLGRSTVYFPKSTYNITGPITIGGSVRRVVGLGSAINSTGSFFNSGGVVFTFASTLTGAITFENFVATYESSPSGKFFEDRSPNTVVLRNLIVGGDPVYNNVGTGVVAGKKLFIEDVTMSGFVFNNLKVWARQINPEGRTTSIINNGSDLLILGLKSEGIRTIIDNRGGGRTELLGAYIYPVPLAGDPPLDPSTPAFINTDSTLAITVAGSWNDNWVHEVRSGVTQTLITSQTIGPAGFRKIPLYSSHVIPSAVAAASGLGATANSAGSITLRWTDNATSETGFTIERRTGGGTFAAVGTVASDVTAFSDFGLSSSTTYTYRILATGGTTSPYSNEASATTQAGAVGAPSNVVVTPSAAAAVISVAWQDNSANETGFVIERSVAGGAFSTLTTTAANVVGYTDGGLIPGTSYSYRLRATTASGDSATTSAAVAVTLPDAPTLAAGSDSGFSSTDRITRFNLPTFTGTAQAGSTARLFVGGLLSNSVVVPASGVWTLAPAALLADGVRTLTVVVADVSGAASPASAALSVTIDTVAPSITTTMRLTRAAYSLRTVFSEDVSPSFAPADLTLLNRTTSQPVGSALTAAAFSVRTGTFSFPGFAGGVLPNADYRATLAAGSVEDAAGNLLTGSTTLDFFILTGDVNLDRTVDVVDLGILSTNFNLTSAAYSDGDLSGDGLVDVVDLGILTAGYNSSLPFLPPPAPIVFPVPKSLRGAIRDAIASNLIPVATSAQFVGGSNIDASTRRFSASAVPPAPLRLGGGRESSSSKTLFSAAVIADF